MLAAPSRIDQLTAEHIPEEDRAEVEAVTHEAMIAALSERTGQDVAAQENAFNAFAHYWRRGGGGCPAP